MRKLAICAFLCLTWPLSAALGAAPPLPTDRKYEGDWYVIDATNNNTGEREVYAFLLHRRQNEPDQVTLTMRCTEGKPIVYIEWEGVDFPERTLIAVSPARTADSRVEGAQYAFEMPGKVTEPGLRASPETSARIIAALGDVKHAIFTARPAAGSRTVKVDIAGTPGAWSRVSRHCPVRLMPRPPL